MKEDIKRSSLDKTRSQNWATILDNISRQAASSQERFNKDEHDTKSRLEITKLFLKWYFFLIVGSFLFSLVYNFGAAYINQTITAPNLPIPYLDISNTVSLITATLSSGVGFVIGYYFKNKGE